MKISHFIIIAFFLNLLAPVVLSQDLKEDKIVVIKGGEYIFHKVRKGETIFSLSQKYKVERKVLIYNNPMLIMGLKVGETIKIPYKGNLAPQDTRLEREKPSGFIRHKVKRRETPYFLAKKYGVSIEDLYHFNPGMKKLRKGAVIKIPQWDEKPEKAVSVDKPGAERGQRPTLPVEDMIVHRVKPGETLYSISKKYNRTIREILYYNPDARNLRIGMEIRLPKLISTENINEGKAAGKVGEYFIHTIETGETLYGLQKKYFVPREELIKANPVLKTGFPAGVQLKIPVKYLPHTGAKPVNEDAFIKHTVKKGETLYGLSTLYKIKIPEIKKYNPALESRDGLLMGEVILIPKPPIYGIVQPMGVPKEDSARVYEDYYKVEAVIETPEGCKPKQNQFFFETYQVGLLLPLFLEANDTLNIKPVEDGGPADEELVDTETELGKDTVDTIIEDSTSEVQSKRFYLNSENFLYFYEGVLIAIDSMKKRGISIDLHVFDTKRDSYTVDSIVATDEFRNLDLIIGPIYPSLQKVVADYAYKNRIPMVSPLSSNSSLTGQNPYYFQVNPSYSYLLSQTAELIAEEYFDSNFIVFKTNADKNNPEELLVRLCHEKLFNSGYYSSHNDVSFSIYDFYNQGGFGIPRILSKEKENVFIVPSSSEGEISVAVSNINNYAGQYDITFIGTNKYHQYESISQEYFHNVKLKYISPYWIDYSSVVVNDFYAKFRDIFKTEPNQFSIQGYDVSFYFLNALYDYGKDFFSCLPYLNVGLVQGNYNFVKVSQMGGYMNHGCSVISYNRDYTVSREREIGLVKPVSVQK